MRFMVLAKANRNTESEIETRQMFEASDFGPVLTPEVREAEEHLHVHAAGKR